MTPEQIIENMILEMSLLIASLKTHIVGQPIRPENQELLKELERTLKFLRQFFQNVYGATTIELGNNPENLKKMKKSVSKYCNDLSSFITEIKDPIDLLAEYDGEDWMKRAGIKFDVDKKY